MRFRFSVLFIISVLLFACQKAQQQADSADAKHYTLKGTVVAVDKAKKKATIKHEDIPDYMGAMTMEYKLPKSGMPPDIKTGTNVSFEVIQTPQDEFLLTKIERNAGGGK